VGQVLLKPYYADLTEHFFRLAIRSPCIKDRISEMRQAVTLQWLAALSKEDRIFLHQIFKYEHFTTREGLLSLSGDFELNRKRLCALEKGFALYTRLIEEN
jgi:hypothetical protein